MTAIFKLIYLISFIDDSCILYIYHVVSPGTPFFYKEDILGQHHGVKYYFDIYNVCSTFVSLMKIVNR
jgi:hypothetical protein